MIVNIKTFNDCNFFRSFILKLTDLSPVDLAGSTMRMMVRKTAASASALIDISTVNERIVIDYLTPGAFSVLIPLSELSVLAEGSYVHSLIRTQSNLLKSQVWRGTLTHSIGPTR